MTVVIELFLPPSHPTPNLKLAASLRLELPRFKVGARNPVATLYGIAFHHIVKDFLVRKLYDFDWIISEIRKIFFARSSISLHFKIIHQVPMKPHPPYVYVKSGFESNLRTIPTFNLTETLKTNSASKQLNEESSLKNNYSVVWHHDSTISIIILRQEKTLWAIK